jgi:hypothetical protein
VRLVTVWGVGYRWDSAGGELDQGLNETATRAGSLGSEPIGGRSR